MMIALMLMMGCVGKVKYDALQTELDQTQTELTKVNSERTSLKDALAAEQAKSAALDAEKARLMSDSSALKGSVAEMESALRELAVRKAASDARIAEFKSLLSRFQSLIDAGKLKVKIVDGRMGARSLRAAGALLVRKFPAFADRSAVELLRGIARCDLLVRCHSPTTICSSMLPSGESAQVTQTEGQLMSCPMEGPRLAEVTGTLLLVWADASMDGRTWMATSDDGVASWSAERDVMGRTGTSSPTIASSGGDVYITTEMEESSLLVKVTDGGATFGSPSELVSPSGGLGYAQVDAGGGVVIAAGSASDGSAWIYRP